MTNITFSNFVLDVKIRQVRAIDHLTVGTLLADYMEESDRPPWPSSTFRSGVPLNFTAVVVSGEVSSYTFYVEGQEITTTSHYIEHTFHVVSDCMKRRSEEY